MAVWMLDSSVDMDREACLGLPAMVFAMKRLTGSWFSARV
jgi:hypothetical protein